MAKYQDPNFSRDDYWLKRRANAADRRAHRLGLRYRGWVAIHSNTPGEPIAHSSKPPTKKAVQRNSKRARKHITYAS